MTTIKIDSDTGRRVLQNLKVNMAASTSQAVSNLPEELQAKLTTVCAPKQGVRRDWDETADVIMECWGDRFDGMTEIEIDPVTANQLTPYMRYVLRLGCGSSGVFAGTGPIVAGVKTPHSTGSGYDKQRDALFDAMLASGITRQTADTKSGYTGTWVLAETGEKVRFVLTAADTEEDMSVEEREEMMEELRDKYDRRAEAAA